MPKFSPYLRINPNFEFNVGCLQILLSNNCVMAIMWAISIPTSPNNAWQKDTVLSFQSNLIYIFILWP